MLMYVYIYIFIYLCQCFILTSYIFLCIYAFMTRKAFTTRLDEQLLKEVKKLAIDLDCDVNDLLEEAIKYLLQKHGTPWQ